MDPMKTGYKRDTGRCAVSPSHIGTLSAGSPHVTITGLANRLCRAAALHFGCSDGAPPVYLDLRGRSAGQWRVRNDRESLHFNMRLFEADPDQHLPDTVAHEVAHCIVYRCHGRGVRPHGSEWRRVMAFLGCEPRVTHRASPETLARVLGHHLYRCACRTHALGPQQHRRASDGERRYCCRVCGEALVPAP